MRIGARSRMTNELKSTFGPVYSPCAQQKVETEVLSISQLRCAFVDAETEPGGV